MGGISILTKKMFCILLILLLFHPYNAVFVTPIGDAKDGCLYYAEPYETLISPSEIEGTYVGEGAYGNVEYDIDLYIPEINAQTSEIATFRIGIVGASIHNPSLEIDDYVFSVSASQYGSCSVDGNIYPTSILKTGQTNELHLESQMWAMRCGDYGYDTSKIDMLKLCLFYPELTISTSEYDDEIYLDESILLNVTISNYDDVEAKDVRVILESENFYVEPSEYSFDIAGSYNEKESTKTVFFSIEPKYHNELEFTDSVEKKVGTIIVGFNDVTEKGRAFEKDLGYMTVKKVQENDEEVETINNHEQEENDGEMNASNNTLLVLLIGLIVGMVILGIVAYFLIKKK